MKTIFQMGFAQHSVFLVQQRYAPPALRLGQDSTPSPIDLSKSDRDSLLVNINRAAEENKSINAFKQNANWLALLGPDASKFNDFVANAEPYSGTALAVQQRLAIGTSWQLTGQEWSDSNTWIQSIDAAWKLMQAHQPAAAAKAGVTPPATPGVSPVLIGVGAAAALALLVVVLA